MDITHPQQHISPKIQSIHQKNRTPEGFTFIPTIINTKRKQHKGQLGVNKKNLVTLNIIGSENTSKQNKEPKNITIFYQNVRSLRTRTKTIFLNTLIQDYDIICHSETWLSNDINDGELFNTKYQVVRQDRYPRITGKNRGGGVLIALKSNFLFENYE